MKKLSLILLFLSSPGWGAIALASHTSHGDCITTISPSVGDVIGVCCSSQSGTYATGVTDNASGGSNTYTEVTTSRGGFGSGVSVTNAFYSQIIHGGATTITCAGSCYDSAAYDYTGALTSGNPIDVSTGSVNQNCVASVCTGPPITTLNAGDAIFTCAQPGVNITAVAAPYTDFLDESGNGMGSADYIPGTPVTASSAVWTSSSGDIFGTSVIAILPAAGGAAATPCPSPFCGVIGQ